MPPPLLLPCHVSIDKTKSRLTGHTTFDSTFVSDCVFLFLFFCLRHGRFCSLCGLPRCTQCTVGSLSMQFWGANLFFFRNPFSQDCSEPPRVIFVIVSFRLLDRRGFLSFVFFSLCVFLGFFLGSGPAPLPRKSAHGCSHSHPTRVRVGDLPFSGGRAQTLACSLRRSLQIPGSLCHRGTTRIFCCCGFVSP